ncbi:MAG: polysaccharide deacetylase family protein, partial [Planctomycetota bacterium]
MPAADHAAAERSLAILAFHKIGEPPPGTWTTWNYIPTATFTGQLKTLLAKGYTVLNVAEFLEGLTHPWSLPERAALLTFDDAYASMVTVAQPCLARFGLPAVLFVPTDFVGGSNVFDQDSEPAEPICSWAQLRELQLRGISIQSHGVSHRSFSELTAAEQALELSDSRSRLEGALDASVEVFAFPYGDGGNDPEATDAATETAGYRAACLYKGGPVRLPTQ